MSRRVLLPALLLLATATAAAADPGDLAETVKRAARESGGERWLSYTVPLLEGSHRLCCSQRWEAATGASCDLDGGSFHVTSDADAPGSLLLVLLRVDGGEPDRVRAFDSSCRVRTRDGIRPLGAVDGAESVAYLATLARTGGEDAREGALLAIAYHAAPEAMRTLTGFTDAREPAATRSRAAFWLGATRGDVAFATLRRMVLDDPSSDVREQAIFAVSISDAPQTEPFLLELARDADDPTTRARALFWLAQKAGEKIADTLRDAAVDDPELEVKQHAVFALSQLPDGQGVTRLIEIARTHRNPEVRRSALFWLGQSHDPRALDLIEEVLR